MKSFPEWSMHNEIYVPCIKTNNRNIENYPCEKYKKSLINCLTKHNKITLSECGFEINCWQLCVSKNKPIIK
jgi:hypothetical protein